MIDAHRIHTPFQEGDAVVLAEGPYQGSPGVFLRLTEDDVNWAEINEGNGIIRHHPVVWLQHCPAPRPSGVENSGISIPLTGGSDSVRS